MDTMTPAEIYMPIGKEQVVKASVELNRYKSGKAVLTDRIIRNEEWYRLHHSAEIYSKSEQDRAKEHKAVEPTSAWLLNAVINRHADSMDNYPKPTVLPREEGDKDEAKVLSSILPVLMDRNGFRKVYSDEQWNKIKHGTGCFGVYWDKTAQNGLGEIAVRSIDLLNLYWEPGIADIQDSENVFYVQEISEEAAQRMIPDLRGGQEEVLPTYHNNDGSNDKRKIAVVDWYYKVQSEDGRTVLHYCQYIGDTVIYATENDPQMAERGLYDHGKYPFVLDVLYPEAGTPTGFGIIEMGRSPQEYIDRLGESILQNAMWGSRPRIVVPEGAGINEDEMMDTTRQVVHTQGATDGVVPLQVPVLQGNHVQVLISKVDELKETLSNRDVQQGGVSGTTTASGIAAQQQAGGKAVRDSNGMTYEAYKEVVTLVIELIRQFYDTVRYFRIVGEGGQESFVQYINTKLARQVGGIGADGEAVYRDPVFDIDVTAERQSSYSRTAQNEMALQFYSAGFFNPGNASPALACLDMMDFDGKDSVMRKISVNGTLYQQLMQVYQLALAMAQQIDAAGGTAGVYTAQVQQLMAQAQGTAQALGAVERGGVGGAGIPGAVVRASQEAGTVR